LPLLLVPGPGRGPPDGNRGRGSVPVPVKSGTGTGTGERPRFRTNRGRGRGSVPVPGQIRDRPRDRPRRLSACAEHWQPHFNNLNSRQLNASELMPSSIRRHHPRREGPNRDLKKTQRQHSVSGAERWSYCQCLDAHLQAVVPTHLTLNLAVMSSSALELRLVRVGRLQLLSSLLQVAVTVTARDSETDSHWHPTRSPDDVVTHGSRVEVCKSDMISSATSLNRMAAPPSPGCVPRVAAQDRDREGKPGQATIFKFFPRNASGGLIG
jgi:hypothetical protein